MKTKIFFLINALFLLSTALPSANQQQQQYGFNELWGYVMKGEETFLSNSMPFTDIGYFSAAVNEQGRLSKDIKRPNLKGEFDKPVRIHLVISAPWNKTIMNFAIRKDFPLRDQIIKDIIELSKDFDGVQIDFESLNWEDRDYYLTFLEEVRSRLPKRKIFSVAVPARWWTKENPFDYAEIAKIADRVIVMAYDEHWRTGPAGPIASLPWCKKTLDFSQKHIPPEKLVMGIPLYGRSWQVQPTPTASRHSQVMNICKENSCVIKRTPSGTPYFEYKAAFDIAIHFEDLQTITEKIETYHKHGVQKLSFWRVGQEPPGVWKVIRNQ